VFRYDIQIKLIDSILIYFILFPQIIKNRIEKEYRLEPFFGKLHISYRESLEEPYEHYTFDEKQIKSARNSVAIRLKVVPCEPNEFRLPHKVKVISTAENNLKQLRIDRLHSIENGVRTALEHGSLLGFPVINCRVELLEFVCNYTTIPSFVSACVQKCMHQALQSSKPYLLEPIMRLEVITPEELYGPVLKDLTNRRSTIGTSTSKNKRRILTAFTPLSELTGYSTALRRLTSGQGNLFMQLHDYQRLSVADQNRLVHECSGYV
jgi:elongation factor G